MTIYKCDMCHKEVHTRILDFDRSDLTIYDLCERCRKEVRKFIDDVSKMRSDK